MEYRLFYGKQSVTEYESIRQQETVHMDYPYDMEQEILRQAIRFHNRVKTMERLDKFAERMRHISAEDANLYIHQLGVAVNRALRQTEGISVNHLYSMREFSHFMDALTTLKEKQQQIRATLDELFQMAAEGADRNRSESGGLYHTELPESGHYGGGHSHVGGTFIKLSSTDISRPVRVFSHGLSGQLPD